MSEHILFRLKDIAKKTGATIPQIKYWLKLLGFVTVVRSRVAHVTQSQAMTIEQLATLIAEGCAPSEAVTQIGSEHVSTAIISADDPMIRATNWLEAMEHAMLEMATTFKNGMSALHQEVTALRQENKGLRSQLLSLMPPQKPTNPVIPWHPKKAEDPLAGKSWIEKAWLQLVRPEHCRRKAN